ncbi:hypothetical protein Kpol_489p6 [Vanderwaltozyma polyspora DSM 70294]|uniref:Reduced meiotic recombination protein 1 n=1 Tax=Vanderwaltozyma polyspora (strain ATCC 22028 / DSM 70294 / BCRC 21397 / CBS 2163 / NBRC 10782 / NRRL Y-8283 / UCD 57-17) TaxID=436907 RepID=A7TQ20_VANPO|nr:uncharacterized protein Kpol_489p6 [Vanderwaltozyma polyspora DSM 70294]EDO15625.1 hypothetical protein Kpol_489p6 [Vanderwaltozyma polyspora DSM 70294]
MASKSESKDLVDDDGVCVTLDDDVCVSLDDSVLKKPKLEEKSTEAENNDAKGGNDNTEVQISIEDQIKEAAKALLKKKIPTIVILYEGTRFLLFNSDEPEAELAAIVCEDESMLHQNCGTLMKVLREFMENYYGKLHFVTKELMMEIPCLELTLCEDNIYNEKITFNDILSIFEILRERSIERGENGIPDHLNVQIAVRPRFVSRYNSLVELTESDASLSNIKPFSNDECNPLVLDDEIDGGEVVSEIVVTGEMEIEEID